MGVYSEFLQLQESIRPCTIFVCADAFSYNTDQCLHSNSTQHVSWAYTLAQITPLHDIGAKRGKWRLLQEGGAYTPNVMVHIHDCTDSQRLVLACTRATTAPSQLRHSGMYVYVLVAFVLARTLQAHPHVSVHEVMLTVLFPCVSCIYARKKKKKNTSVQTTYITFCRKADVKSCRIGP